MLCRVDRCVSDARLLPRHNASISVVRRDPRAPREKLSVGSGSFNRCCQCESVRKCTNSRGEEHLVVRHLLPFLRIHRMEYPVHFLEIGAYDGLHASNTLYLEHCLGWRGILIEAPSQVKGRIHASRALFYTNAERIRRTASSSSSIEQAKDSLR